MGALTTYQGQNKLALTQVYSLNTHYKNITLSELTARGPDNKEATASGRRRVLNSNQLSRPSLSSTTPMTHQCRLLGTLRHVLEIHVC